MATSPNFEPVIKDRLFYGSFLYCISFQLDEISCLKNLDHDYIDAVIDRRRVWREVTHQRRATIHNIAQAKTAVSQTILTHRIKEITPETVENLHDLANLLINTTTDFKLVTSVDIGWVYTNSIHLIKRLTENTAIKDKKYTKAIVDRPKNTVKLKNPKNTHRSYFKSIKISDTEKNNLKNFCNNHPDIRLGPSLIAWFNMPYHRTQDYFFIDHNGESWLVMLALVHPGLIRKTTEIIAG
jgi:hypothetical protein